MLGEAFGAIDELYPAKRWGQPKLAGFDVGIGDEEGVALADELAAYLGASASFRPGGEDEYCDYIYVQCIGREPNLVQIRDLEVPVPEELDADTRIVELYLRVCLSNLGRFAAVQQVEMELSWGPGGALIEERPRPGVYDAPLLGRLQRLVAVLPDYGIVHLDFGEICAPVPGFDGGHYESLFAGEPLALNYLFYPQPPTCRTTSLVAAS